MKCEHCGFRFFSRDLSETELIDIYGEYRQSSYLVRRRRWEPWYTKKINDAIGHDRSVVLHRKEQVESELMNYLDSSDLKSPTVVVDFGGDAGQFIPDLSSLKERFVLEVSDAATEAGVERLSSWEDIEQVKPDFIMMCHVLEHTKHARELVERAYGALEPGGLLYIEIPLDGPPIPRKIHSRRSYGTYTRLLARSRLSFAPIDFVSLVSRRFTRRILPGAVLKQSEHIQYFELDSLETVLRAVGFENFHSMTYLASGHIPRLKTLALGVFASKPNKQASSS
jgi:SAM-dependent methyltransferase